MKICTNFDTKDVKKNKNYGDGAAWIRGPLIGKGSFGSVYRATLKKKRNPTSKLYGHDLPSTMAVKSSEASVSSTLRNERETMRRLKGSPYLIECFGDETTMDRRDGSLLAYNLLLEYCSGGNLAQRIKKSPSGLPESEIRVYARCILRGLDHIHRAGYVHCDLKPDNILLTKPFFRAKICDFGLAKRGGGGGCCRRGTTMYMSPEAVVDNIQEAASDVWAVGCVVFKMLTGKHVWGGEKAEEILKQIGTEDELPKIPEGTNISEVAKDFVKCCLVRDSILRPSAPMLLDHPFLDGLENDDVDDDVDWSDGFDVDVDDVDDDDSSFLHWFENGVDDGCGGSGMGDIFSDQSN
ncbi:hypothetical protein ABFS82_12G022800 [Erythranthe guttata]|uniref:mitogen-activated protein kinase kinase kinase 2-like n=1 Tax=Erythranthe guttata TaxID=4155 RepID=UPI00064DED9A|nr:PREDICTED: mitogen-activated protein kinase kinase kinase 2-like [Erythranthe guttata]|eukprot:XP_012832542.1 PREDICTED: mitogen-activated protein kinase kinase kinase 2-like [Erythranthe guttata]